jgi:hypothetical protein
MSATVIAYFMLLLDAANEAPHAKKNMRALKPHMMGPEESAARTMHLCGAAA